MQFLFLASVCACVQKADKGAQTAFKSIPSLFSAMQPIVLQIYSVKQKALNNSLSLAH